MAISWGTSMIKVGVSDGVSGGCTAAVVNGGNEDHALVVATRPLKTFTNSIRFFSNDEEGIDMNVDASAGGTPVKVHDGTDSSLWTASDIVGGGTTTFNSTDQNHTAAGTKSIKVDNSPIGDIYQLNRGSDLDCTGYVSLTLWVYSDKDWKNNDVVELYGWDTGTGLQVGDSVDLGDYFTYDDYDVWQKITIPLTDMGDLAISTTLDAIRIEQVAKEGAKAPKYYLDDIQFEQTGTPIVYSISPDKGTWLHVKEFTISIVNAHAGTLVNGTMPNIPYDGLLGQAITSGITYQRIQDGEVDFSATISSLIGLLELPGTDIVSQGSDGTNTWVTIRVRHIEPLTLKEECCDKLQWTVSEDMSGLIRLRITAGGSIEMRKKGVVT